MLVPLLIMQSVQVLLIEPKEAAIKQESGHGHEKVVDCSLHTLE